MCRELKIKISVCFFKLCETETEWHLKWLKGGKYQLHIRIISIKYEAKGWSVACVSSTPSKKKQWGKVYMWWWTPQSGSQVRELQFGGKAPFIPPPPSPPPPSLPPPPPPPPFSCNNLEEYTVTSCFLKKVGDEETVQQLRTVVVLLEDHGEFNSQHSYMMVSQPSITPVPEN